MEHCHLSPMSRLLLPGWQELRKVKYFCTANIASKNGENICQCIGSSQGFCCESRGANIHSGPPRPQSGGAMAPLAPPVPTPLSLWSSGKRHYKINKLRLIRTPSISSLESASWHTRLAANIKRVNFCFSASLFLFRDIIPWLFTTLLVQSSDHLGTFCVVF